ncbi:hypothetical protein ACJW31_09G115700 [Castanea mollissima]
MCFSQVVKSLFLVFLLGGTLTQVGCFSFNYPVFARGDSQLMIMLNSSIQLGAIQVTPDVSGASITNHSRRVFYKEPFILWNKSTGATATFTTNFLLGTSPITSLGGEVAVEFDTRKCYPEDLDDNHVGLDVNSIYSIKQFSLTNLQVSSSHLNVIISDSDVMEVFVGFSASTSDNTELNCIRSWEFNGSDIGDGHGDEVSATEFVLSGIVFYLYWKRKQALYPEDPYLGLEHQINGSSTAPQKFLLKELRKATCNFNPKNKLGKGGFGTVYKGHLANKEQEFLLEVTTIGRLHHKNLMRLIGWCYERHELLLAYEFMPISSLDNFGVAEALDYLHDECEKRVLHRDIKASNIMGKTHHSTLEIVGTSGYIAVETFLISSVLVLEVLCGRMPRNQNEENDYNSNIVHWLWELYNEGRMLGAVDSRLNMKFEEEGMSRMLVLALAYCFPNPHQRPSMKAVLQVLIGPTFMWPAMPPSLKGNTSNSLTKSQLFPFTELSRIETNHAKRISFNGKKIWKNVHPKYLYICLY